MNQSTNPSENKFPKGSYPAMPTAFHRDGAIDWEGVDRLTDHCIASGAAGIFACGGSAEIAQMDDDEITQLAERITKRTAGQVPIVACAISTEPIEAQAALVSRIHDAGADAIALGVYQLAGEEENDDTWIRNAETLLELISSDVRLAMYECPQPYHRLVSEQTISWAASSGRFHFLKDTCCHVETIRKRLEIIAGSPLQLFNANTETLLESLQAGVDGFCGIGANYQPELYAWLCKNYEAEPKLAAELHRFLDGTVVLTEDSTYPASAKNYLQQRGLAIGGFSRKMPAGVTAEGSARLGKMLEQERKWLERLGVPPTFV